MQLRPGKTLARRSVGLLATAFAFLTAPELIAQSANASANATTKAKSSAKTAAPTKAATAKTKAAKAAADKIAAAKAAEPIRFVIGPVGNEARYRVREQLVGFDLPSDAVGKTTEVSGTLLAYPDGRIVRDSSRIIVQLGNDTFSFQENSLLPGVCSIYQSLFIVSNLFLQGDGK